MTFKNTALFLAALAIVWILESWLGAFWHEAVVSNQHYSIYKGGFSFLPLLHWLFQLAFFAVAGFLLARIFRASVSRWWVIGLGVACSLLQFSLSNFSAAPDAGAFIYVTYYGGYLMPPAGAFVGTLFHARSYSL